MFKYFPKILIFALTLSLATSTQAAGIQFFEGNWAAALEKAKTERKLIFLDAYAEWCGPCKALVRNTFPREEVGAFYNENFINLRIDMEKGEGVQLAQTYKVAAYPTLLFINHLGEVVHKTAGYMPPKKLIAAGKQALSPEKNFALLELEIESGSKDPEVLFAYAKTLDEQGKDAANAARKYFATQTEKDLLSDRNWEAIETFTTDLDSREYQVLLAKQKKFMKAHGIQPVANKLYHVLEQTVLEDAESGNGTEYQKAVAAAEKNFKDKGLIASSLRMLHHEQIRDWKAYADQALYHFDTYIIPQPKPLNRAARNFADNIDDVDMLVKAVAWARQSIAIENDSYNNETLARLYLKLDQPEKALTAANKALRLEILKDGDTSKLEKLMTEIRAKQN
ncbi:MAG: thioredoxin family protein [Bacteroidota bacterium]